MNLTIPFYNTFTLMKLNVKFTYSFLTFRPQRHARSSSLDLNQLKLNAPVPPEVSNYQNIKTPSSVKYFSFKI